MNFTFLSVILIILILSLVIGQSYGNIQNTLFSGGTMSYHARLICLSIGLILGVFAGGNAFTISQNLTGEFSFGLENSYWIFLFAVLMTEIVLFRFFNYMKIYISPVLTMTSSMFGAVIWLFIVSKTNNSASHSLSGLHNFSGLNQITSVSFLLIILAFAVGFVLVKINGFYSRARQQTIDILLIIMPSLSSSVSIYWLLQGQMPPSRGIQNIFNLIPPGITASIFFFICFLFLLVLRLKFKALFYKIIPGLGWLLLSGCFSANDLAFVTGLSFNGFSEPTGLIPDSSLTPLLLMSIAVMVVVISIWLRKPVYSEPADWLFSMVKRKNGSLLWKEIVASIRNIVIPKDSHPLLQTQPIIFQNNTTEVASATAKESTILFISIILVSWGISMHIPVATSCILLSAWLGVINAGIKKKKAFAGLTSFSIALIKWITFIIVACILSFFLAFILYETFPAGMFIFSLVLVVILLQKKVYAMFFSGKSKKQEIPDIFLTIDGTTYDTYSQNIVNLLITSHQTLEKSVKGLINGNKKELKESRKAADILNDEIKKLKKQIPILFKELNDESFESGMYYVDIIDSLYNAMHSLNHIAAPAFKYVNNNNKPLSDFQIRTLQELSEQAGELQVSLIMSISESEFTNAGRIIESIEHFIDELEKDKKEQLKLFRVETEKTRTNVLYLDMLNELKKFMLCLSKAYSVVAFKKIK